ncbi:MAG: DUF6056 family protein [Spirochaetaceae bacterium]|jgi:hypothetical protein|nr:DUF6056 family protein [Spirochaetaceae bacterium]
MLRKFLIPAGIIILFYILNILTPLIADDYSYSLGINSVADIPNSVYGSWLGWNGRCIVLFLAQFWLLVGKPYFNLANTLVYCAFILLTYFHITGGLRKFKPALFVAINLFYWFLVPAWGQNFLWLTGSCGYLWATLIVLFFLVPFRKKSDFKEYNLNIVSSALFFIIGLMAGCSYENIGAAVLFLLIAYFVMKILNKEKISLFEITGTAGFLLGFALLVAAPGNYVRMDIIMSRDHYKDAFAIIMFKRFVEITIVFFKNYGATLIAITALFAFDLLHHQKRRLNVFSYFYALAALAAVWSMMLAPVFPDRSFLPVTVFSGITLGTVISRFKIQVPAMVQRNYSFIVCLLILAITPFFVMAFKNIAGIHFKWQNRIDYILSEKEKGNLDVEVKAPIPATDRHAALYGLSDISDDENDWPNTSIAEYFGLRKIKKSQATDWGPGFFKR